MQLCINLFLESTFQLVLLAASQLSFFRANFVYLSLLSCDIIRTVLHHHFVIQLRNAMWHKCVAQLHEVFLDEALTKIVANY